jgi:hypothetical protein
MKTKIEKYQDKLNQVLKLISLSQEFNFILSRKEMTKKLKIGEKLISIAIDEGLISKSKLKALVVNEMSVSKKRDLIKKVVMLYTQYNKEKSKVINSVEQPKVIQPKSIEERLEFLEARVLALEVEAKIKKIGTNQSSNTTMQIFNKQPNATTN